MFCNQFLFRLIIYFYSKYCVFTTLSELIEENFKVPVCGSRVVLLKHSAKYSTATNLVAFSNALSSFYLCVSYLATSYFLNLCEWTYGSIFP